MRSDLGHAFGGVVIGQDVINDIVDHLLAALNMPGPGVFQYIGHHLDGVIIDRLGLGLRRYAGILDGLA
ncbi:hypothetical protein ES703_18940 [subsurface metagenome]